MRNQKSTSPLRLLVLLCIWAIFGYQTTLAQYCLPAYQNPCSSDDYIDHVSFAGILNTGTACGTPGLDNYTNYSGTFTGNVVANQTYPITCEPGPTWGQYFVAMIDFNHDNDFADPGEFFDIGYSFGGGSVSNTITIPCNALSGSTRLRVMCRYANIPLVQADICNTNLTFGEVEDYNLNITQPVATDGKAVRITTPLTGCGLTAAEQVKVRVMNVGGTVINGYTICYRLNGGPAICETVPTTIAICDSVLHTFATTANLAAPGTYTFKAYVTVAGDANHANDTISNHIVESIPTYSSLPYYEHFDGTVGGWTTNGINNSWAWGVPSGTFVTAAASPTKAWTTDLSNVYNPGEFSYLVSPCFNLTAATADPYVEFSHIFETDGYGDYDYVDVSTNGGSTWTRVGVFGTGYNWYNVVGDHWTSTSGPVGKWVTAYHQLTGTAGQANVRYRVGFESDNFAELDGIGIDDMRLKDTIKNAMAVALTAPSNGCNLSTTEAVTITIENVGSHAISNFPVCYRIGAGAPICETVPVSIAVGASYNYTFTSTANLSTPGTYDFTAYANLNGDSLHENDTVRKTVSSYPMVASFPYIEDFEASQGNWASGGTDNNDWAWGAPAKSVIIGAASGNNAWVTAGLGLNTYLDNTNNWVESPCFDLTSLTKPWVTARVWWNSESSWDGTVLEYTTDGGATWNEIGLSGDPYNWYTDNTIDGLQTFGATGNGWTGRFATTNDGSNGYVHAKHSIAALAGQSGVRFRMHFATDGSVTDDGFAFDLFVVADAPTVDLGPDTMMCYSYTIDPNLVGGEFNWSNGDTTATTTVTTPGTYYLNYVDVLGLPGMDSVTVTGSPTSPVSLGPDAVICHGNIECLFVDTLTYSNVHWSTGANTGQICVNIAGTWSVSVEDASGCTSIDTITTTVVAIPTPYIGADTAVCAGDTICMSINCGPNHTYVWSNGATTSTICVTNILGYWAQCIDANGCVGADTIILTQQLAPTAAASFDTTNCPIVQFTNMSTGTVTGVHWDFGDGGTSTTSSTTHDYTGAGNGSYTVTFISSNDCGDDTTQFVVDINCLVSIGSALDNQLKLFPNPNNGQFKLETILTGSAPVKVTIEDLQGRSVYSRDFGQASGKFSEEIKLEGASKGVYFVRFDVGGQVAVKKIVLQ